MRPIYRHRSHVGHVRLAAFSSRALYVGTDAPALAALAPRTGAVLWRRMLDEPLSALELADRALVSVSASGRRIACWDAAVGRLLWEASVVVDAANTSTRTNVRLSTSSSRAAVLGPDGVLRVYAVATGQLLWQQAPRDGAADRRTIVALALPADAPSIVVAVVDARGVSIAHYDADTGRVGGDGEVLVLWHSSGDTSDAARSPRQPATSADPAATLAAFSGGDTLIWLERDTVCTTALGSLLPIRSVCHPLPWRASSASSIGARATRLIVHPVFGDLFAVETQQPRQTAIFAASAPRPAQMAADHPQQHASLQLIATLGPGAAATVVPLSGTAYALIADATNVRRLRCRIDCRASR